MKTLIAVLFLLYFILPSVSFSKPPGQEITLALVGGEIYPSPTEMPIANGVVLVRGGKIVVVGAKDKIQIPKEAIVLDCNGNFVTAGFQNSHVHFTEQKWENAGALPTAQLNTQLQEMFTRYGFTTVVDTGSFLRNAVALRSRIVSGEVNGPRILTAGSPLYPVNGIPYYVKDSLPPAMVALLATPKTPFEAASVVRERLAGGADIIKLFTGSWIKRGEVLPMPVDIATAAATEAHGKGKLVFSHASDIRGLEVALESGIDVLAHALDDDRGLTPSHIERMKTKNLAVVPTLKLFGGQPYTKFIVKEVGDFFRAGIDILFGTDVGYLTDYDPTLEYELLSQAGLNWNQILASLTTVPAKRFNEPEKRGRIAPGLDADLIVLTADPATDVQAFSKVRYTLRAGKVVYGE